MSIGDALGMAVQLGPFGGAGMNAAQNSIMNDYANQMKASAWRSQGEEGIVGQFKIIKAEDGFIIRCARGEGYTYKTYVANDIDEAFDKAKAHLVSEALK